MFSALSKSWPPWKFLVLYQKKHYFSIIGNDITLCLRKSGKQLPWIWEVQPHIWGTNYLIFFIPYCLWSSESYKKWHRLLSPLPFISPQFLSTRRQGRQLYRLALAPRLLPVFPTLPQCWHVWLQANMELFICGLRCLMLKRRKYNYSRFQNWRADEKLLIAFLNIAV